MLTSLCIASALLYIGHRLWSRLVPVARMAAARSHVVLITGCDTGLGFSMAVHAHRLGLTVVAACLDVAVSGPRLEQLCEASERLRVVQCDVTSQSSVDAALQAVRGFLRDNPDCVLRTVVNNAAVMVFGEFEWQTEQQIRHQVEVNLLGTLRVTKTFCSLIRRSKGRIVIVSSHCALASLHGLAVYGATKGGLRNFADSLRVEEAKYGVSVVSLIPGSFVMKSNIMSRHSENAREMERAMSAEDRSFFGSYFDKYHSYLNAICDPDRVPTYMPDEATWHDLFSESVLAIKPRATYLNEPMRYTIYHCLFKMSPTTWLRDYFVQRFVQMPAYEPSPE